MACRVCLALGIDDPVRWLDRTRPETLALWEAYYRYEPFGDEWLKHAQQCSVISNVTSMVAASVGVKSKPPALSTFMPESWIGNKSNKKKRKASIASFMSWARQYEKK